MSCAKWEAWISLHAGGDLAEREARELEEHLAACSGCQRLAEGLARSQGVLRSLREEAIDEGALAQVRRRVLNKVGSRKPSWLLAARWPYAFAAGLAVVLLAIALPKRPAAPPPPAAPVLRLPAPVIAKSPRLLVPRQAQRPPATAASTEPLLVKMFTDDPEVVIYWIIDQKTGDSI